MSTQKSQNRHKDIKKNRYRGYYYDAEMGFYWLQSRYYDPAIGRFINVDGLVSTGQGVLSYNMFAYCLNDPVNRYDPNGCGSSITDILKEIAEKVTSGLAGQTSTLTKSTTFDSGTIYRQRPAPTNTYDDFLAALALKESSNNYLSVNSANMLGKYQMSHGLLQDGGLRTADGWNYYSFLKYGIKTDNDFLNNPKAQEEMVRVCHKVLWDQLGSNGGTEYIGTVFMGVEVTESGLLAAGHLVGGYGASYGLINGIDVKDGNGTPMSSYMRDLGGYRLW